MIRGQTDTALSGSTTGSYICGCRPVGFNELKRQNHAPVPAVIAGNRPARVLYTHTIGDSADAQSQVAMHAVLAAETVSECVQKIRQLPEVTETFRHTLGHRAMDT